jgi:phosphatidylglycerol lysyltransferase
LDRWRSWPWRWLFSLASLALLALALWWLHRELAHLRPADVRHAIAALPASALLAALAATAISYIALAGQDALALRLIGRSLPAPRVAATAFMATAVGHNLGFALVSGGAVRLRLYGAWGLSAAEVATVMGLGAAGLAMGLLFCGGFALALEPPSLLATLGLPAALGHGTGLLLAALPLAGLAWLARARPGQALPWWPYPRPRPAAGLASLTLAVIDLSAASLVLWSLLPAGTVGWPTFLGLFVLAALVGIVSHVPGGLGVFEAVLIAGLPQANAQDLLAAALAYRAIYYLLPLALTALIASAMLLRAHGRRWWRLARRAQPAVTWVAPWVGSAMVFAAGAVLLVSGSLPARGERLHWLGGVLPLPLLEVSHLAGSLIGLALLVLSQALLRRIAAAHRLAVLLLLAGAAASLVKGLDVEESAIALLTAGVLYAGRAAFNRPARLEPTDLGPAAWLGIGAVVLASAWVGLFSYRHVEYRNELWWHVALHGNAPRYLRATLLVSVACATLALWQAVRPRPPGSAEPTAGGLKTAQRLVAEAPRTDAALVLLGDKRLLIDPEGLAFVMYQVQGGSWIAMGDPVGAAPEGDRLAWQLLEMADRHGARAAFYQVEAHRLPLYLDMGLAATKLGEEAIVPLAGFSLEGAARANLRRAHRKAEREGLRYEVIDASAVDAALPRLRAVSQAWLQGKTTREKGFSLGRFDEAYLRHFPHALVWRSDELVAFANLWTGDGRTELSIDLMRHLPTAPGGVMDYLFVETMRWGAARGFQRFNLGMAPLAGLETHPLAPLWHRVGTTLFHNGEHFYNFQGLRAYKAKFDPVWQPRYLAAPGGLALPGVLFDLASLIGGGWRGIVAR